MAANFLFGLIIGFLFCLTIIAYLNPTFISVEPDGTRTVSKKGTTYKIVEVFPKEVDK